MAAPSLTFRQEKLLRTLRERGPLGIRDIVRALLIDPHYCKYSSTFSPKGAPPHYVYTKSLENSVGNPDSLQILSREFS